jgi:Fe-Mn family superoxide dismutase
MKYEVKSFNIPELEGISAKNIEEHLKLYEGYVKHVNLFLDEFERLGENPEEHTFALTEMQRRFSFEFDGMRNHEFYFSSFEGGPSEIKDDELKSKIEDQWGSFDKWLNLFKTIAKTRGVGWAILYYDKQEDKLLNAWIDEQHLGHLNGCQPILALDMWEHSFVADYHPSGKGQYIEDYFKNVNWSVIEENYKQAIS